MKYPTAILFLSFLFAFSNCKKENTEINTADAPVSIEQFQINFTAVSDFDTVLKVKKADRFRINYNLKDDGIIKYHTLYLLVDNNPDLKFHLFYPTSPETSDQSFGFVFDNLERLYLDNQEFYDTKTGDKLHFFLLAEDEAGNRSERTFVVELE